MSEKVKIQFDAFEVEKKDIRSVDIVLPFGEFSCKIDFSDMGIVSRVAEIGEYFANRDKYITATDDNAIQAIDIINKIKNAPDYVFNINVCNDIYAHIEPFSVVSYKGEKTIFSMLIVQHIQQQINTIKSAEQMDKSKNDMRKFVEKHA